MLGEAGSTGRSVVDEDRGLTGVWVVRGRDAPDVPTVTRGEEGKQSDAGVLGGVQCSGQIGRFDANRCRR